MKYTDKQITDFLRESNAIEGVYDQDSLDQAKYAWEYLVTQKEMHGSVVLKTHKIIALHSHLLPNQRGYWRKAQVWVGGREGLDWKYIPEAMEVWCMNAWYFPQHWKEHHIRFEQIHPFFDFNGRVGRLLLNWQRLQFGLPILVIKESERQDYYQWFR